VVVTEGAAFTLGPIVEDKPIAGDQVIPCVGVFNKAAVKAVEFPRHTVAPDVTLCTGTTAALSATGATTYSWNPSTNPPSGATVNSSPNISTTYTVTGTDGNGCQNYAAVGVSVVMPVQVTVSPDVTIITGSSTLISATMGGAYYLWTPADFLSCNSCQSATANPITTTVYSVTMWDVNGCFSSGTVIVDVTFICGKLFVPDAFSPNADNVNDVWYVYGAEYNCIDPNSFTLRVFDRWGNKVFESIDPARGWNGKYKDKELDADVFIYSVQTTLTDGTTINKTGNISLIK